MRMLLVLVMLVLCAVFLFGSLFASISTEDSIYFIFGYPVAVILLIVARRIKQ